MGLDIQDLYWKMSMKVRGKRVGVGRKSLKTDVALTHMKERRKRGLYRKSLRTQFTSEKVLARSMESP